MALASGWKIAVPAVAAASLLAYYIFKRQNATKSTRRFDAAAFRKLLQTKNLGQKLSYFEETESTMNLAKAASDQHGALFLAEKQTAGRGRRGRSWASEDAENLYFSFVWTTPETGAAALSSMLKLNFAISTATALACRQIGVMAVVKWPNDVWVGMRKLSGMLVDLENPQTAIVGVGLNVNWQIPTTSPLSGTATSLSSLLGKPVSREAVLAAFCGQLERLMSLPMDVVLAEYTKLDCILGKQIRVHHTSRETSHADDFDATAIGFADDGGLRVRRADGSNVVLRGEEVSIRPADQA